MLETIDQKTPHTHVLPLSVFICTLAGLPYIYDFFLQMSPSVMSHDIMRDFNVTAVGLGSISAFFYYAYCPMQLFAGLSLDRFGPRRLLTMATLLCALGTLLFAITKSVFIASIGRFLIGTGSAFTFIAALLLISRWFPPRYFALLAGITQLLGALGATFGGAPLAYANIQYGWRATLYGSGLFGLLLATIIFAVVRDYPEIMIPESIETTDQQQELHNLTAVCHNSQTWILALYSFLIWAPIVVFGGLWGVPFLMAKYQINETLAGSVLSALWVGVGLGSPAVGWCSDKIGKRSLPLCLCGLVGSIVSGFALYTPGLSLITMSMLLFLVGVAASGQSLSFGVVRDNNHPKFVGTALGFNNMAVVAGGALLQPSVGIILTAVWDGSMQHGIPFYSSYNYQVALTIIPICFILAWFIARFYLIETHCQHQYLHGATDDKDTVRG